MSMIKKISLKQLRSLIRETLEDSMNSDVTSRMREPRDPSTFQFVTDWGFTPISWPEFVKRFPKEAASFVENYTEGWEPEEIERQGGEDPLKWDVLWDDEMFLNREGQPLAFCNMTGPGGSLWQAFDGDGWDEVLLDEDGNIE